jgi:hypothetical protein
MFTHVSCTFYLSALVGRQWCKLYVDQPFFFVYTMLKKDMVKVKFSLYTQ